MLATIPYTPAYSAPSSYVYTDSYGPEWWQNTSTSVSGFSPQIIASLEKIFVFRNTEDIRAFLTNNPFLLPLLFDAYYHISTVFDTVVLFLETFVDREDPSQTQVVLTIAPDQDPESAFDNLSRLDDDWWLDTVDMAQNKMIITLGSL